MKHSSAFPRLSLLAIGGVALAALLLFGSAELRVVLLYLAPFLLLIATLALDCYPGEALIVALVARASRRQRPRRAVSPRISFAGLRPRGGRLLALALAGRAPPRVGRDQILVPTSI